MSSFSENPARATFFKGLWGMKNWVMNSSLYTYFSNYFNWPFNYTHRGAIFLIYSCILIMVANSSHGWILKTKLDLSILLDMPVLVSQVRSFCLQKCYSFNKLWCLLFSWEKLFWFFFSFTKFLSDIVKLTAKYGSAWELSLEIFINPSLFQSFFC